MKYGDQPDRFMESEVSWLARLLGSTCRRHGGGTAGRKPLLALRACSPPAHHQPIKHSLQADLDEAVKAMMVVASAPDLYPELARG